MHIVRFDRDWHMLNRASFADVAVACDDYDQAHLTHNVSALAGCTPSELDRVDVMTAA